jgi:hypothetical protein
MIDRKKESEGVKLYAMPAKLNTEIVLHAKDRDTGKYLSIDNPDHGYDIYFTRIGSDKSTTYGGVDVARAPSPISRDMDKAEEWVDFISTTPVTECIVVKDYDYINVVFNGEDAAKDKEEEVKVSKIEDEKQDTPVEQEEEGASSLNERLRKRVEARKAGLA